MTGRFDGKVALVTGASRGIGYAAALGLAKEGAHVIVLARTVGGLEELDDAIRAEGGSATLVPLNMKDGDGLDRLGAAIYERHGRLDVLLGNAGIMGTATPLGHLQPSVFDDVFAINVTGNFRLLRSMDPLLKASENGRALFITSTVSATPFIAPYLASKAALTELVMSYAAETANTSVCANLLFPGPVRTKMRARYMPGENPKTVPPAATLVLTILDLLAPETRKTGSVWDHTTDRWR